MYDESLELFIEELGEPTSPRIVQYDEMVRFKGQLPDKLLSYWSLVGWSGFSNGLFWLTNPTDFDHLVNLWLEGTGFLEHDKYRVIGRSAFGKLYLMGEKTHQTITINCPMHAIIAMKNHLSKCSKDPDDAVEVFFAMSDKDRYDIEDVNDASLFDQALKNLGPLAPNEVYGFEPILAAGGTLLVDNLTKLDLDIHLTLLRHMGPPKIPF
ncbi:MAG: DUF1851 domain-containing protein [Aliivibrio sp.]|uniref:GAD-like domain-containing protein n=1 Tax=Aliivibrio sp. TaxID=1872443 RepID=UPI001A4B76D3|nr:DUF1851 domain-containing protein [Aliivibrio sp.]